jgi:hypothetical protein
MQTRALLLCQPSKDMFSFNKTLLKKLKAIDFNAKSQPALPSIRETFYPQPTYLDGTL